MEFTVGEAHVKRMAAEAINASKAVGMGWIHFQPSQEITPDDIHIVDGHLSIDYYDGRMVKFHARKIGEDKWMFNPNDLSPDYQSWCLKYPTWELLFEATNI